MSFIAFNDQYRYLLKSGRLPMPYPFGFPYDNIAPNLNVDPNQICADDGLTPFWDGPYDPYYQMVRDGNWDPANAVFNGYVPGPDYLSHDVIPFQDPSLGRGFELQLLNSNYEGVAKQFDVKILDPWNLLVLNDYIYVCNEGGIGVYDLLGRSLDMIINVWAGDNVLGQPTGIVVNHKVGIFVIRKGRIFKPALIIVCTRSGTINAYEPDVDPESMVLVVDNSAGGSVYTGMEVCMEMGTLYVADFYNRRIDMFDENFCLMERRFIDEYSSDPIPEDYSPINVKIIGEELFVMYSRQDPLDRQFEIGGVGWGFISVFDLNGRFRRRFCSRGVLNGPYGIELCPSGWGYEAGSMIISGSDGTISVFGFDGKFVGKLRKCGIEIWIDGLRGFAISESCSMRTVYWVSSGDSFRNGIIGVINSCI